MTQHTITTGHGPIDAGYWPLAHCTCGWYCVSKDQDIVNEGIEQHKHEIELINQALNQIKRSNDAT